jgi:ATP-grasp domain, R2K clade family 3
VVQLLYDPRDDAFHERIGSRILYWLDDLGAVPLGEADRNSPSFLFAGARPVEDYRRMVARLPLLCDSPEQREPLLRLDTVLDSLREAGVILPMPRTWYLPLDAPLPKDLAFPLFVRVAETSWKKGGLISRVTNRNELASEAGELRRAFGWDALVLARQWLDLASAGESRYGPMPQEVRVWIVDRVPFAWTFHHLHIVPCPEGFPLSQVDVEILRDQAGRVAVAFHSRLVVADFARDVTGSWWFIEAGPGSCAGTAHETVFKAVACRLQGEDSAKDEDRVGGLIP